MGPALEMLRSSATTDPPHFSASGEFLDCLKRVGRRDNLLQTAGASDNDRSFLKFSPSFVRPYIPMAYLMSSIQLPEKHGLKGLSITCILLTLLKFLSILCMWSRLICKLNKVPELIYFLNRDTSCCRAKSNDISVFCLGSEDSSSHI